MLKVKSVLYSQLRFKGKKLHWSDLRRKKFPVDKALESFDDFYGSVYGNRWKNLRVALLTENKYIALVNNFSNVEETQKFLENDGAINVKSLVEIAKQRVTRNIDKNPSNDDFSIKSQLDERIKNITEKQEDKEISEIYSKSKEADSLDLTSKKLIFPDSKNSEDDKFKEIDLLNNEEKIDYKMPLEEVIEKHSEIDESRLIDPEKGLLNVLYDYVPATRIKGMEDWVPESDYYKYYSTNNDFPCKFELETDFKFPENLLLYTYEKGNCSEFVEPRSCITGVLSHFLMDGGSILPPLFLSIEPGDKVLDACAAPGGKSLIMLQTLYPEILICNDIQESRVNRILKIMNQYVHEYKKNWHKKRCLITQSDARSINEYGEYDKILVDVPCTTDRHALTVNDNNIFKSTRIKERLRIPELQADILTNCIRLLRPGGTLVYSTCSLSPIQNDGVVHMSLQKVFNEHKITATIKDLSLSIKLFNDIFKFENSKQLKYGQMILPYLPANFGPMYFCKIQRDT